jgi:hypothetical protein
MDKVELKNMKQDETCHTYVDAEMTQFEEVAGTCSNKDDFQQATCTIRSVTIGLLLVFGMSYLHQWANFQLMGPYIASVLVIVVSFPLGRLWARFVPQSKPFTLKEHGFILVMANVAYMYHSVFIYATLTTLRVLERDDLPFAYYFFFGLAIQFLGFGLAGISSYGSTDPTRDTIGKSCSAKIVMLFRHSASFSRMAVRSDLASKSTADSGATYVSRTSIERSRVIVRTQDPRLETPVVH